MFKVLLLFFVSMSGYANPLTLESKISLSFTGCTLQNEQSGVYTYEKSCIENYYNIHPMTFTSYTKWQESIAKPINERLIEADEDMLNYMRIDNLFWDFPYENVEAATDPKLINDARAALADLPQEMSKYINDHFYGFMIVSGVGWTGFASSIQVVEGVPLKAGAVIIINADNIKDRNLNEWLAFREKTTFDFFAEDKINKYPQYNLRMKYVKPGSKSTLQENLRHFLIHETAHLIANADPSVHPAFKYRGKEVPFSEFKKWTKPNEPLEEAFPFLTYSWLFEETVVTGTSEAAYLLSRDVPGYMAPILKAKKIKFYSTDAASKFTVDEAVKIYKGLNKTCFPSLYGMVDYAEDFAETVTHYFMSHRENYRYKVILSKKESKKAKSKVIAQFKDDLWSQPACRKKLKFMDQLFK